MAMVSADSASLRKCARSADWARSRRRGVSVGHSHLLDCPLLPTQPPSASAARTTVPIDVASLAERLGRVVSRDMPFLAQRRCLTHVESAPLAVTMESTKTRDPQQGAALMKRTTKYVALDVHQATTVASVREESGRVIARSVLPTDRGALTEFVRSMRGARHVTFEEGTQAQWLYDVLVPLVDRVIVCDR